MAGAVLGPSIGGCGAKASLSLSPAEIAWGEVDFQQDQPEGGYDPQQLLIENTGDAEIEVELLSFDFDHLCLPGFDGAPATIGAVAAGESFSLFIGVCDYDPAAGERDTVVSGTIAVGVVDGDAVAEAGWSFTPVENITAR
ncbi:MAG: hypothetical protein JNM72_26000 [Deltaproteobacteria bacterium]|nr:hypothetical protein [Deltaproteobacteria bacterium]